MSNQREIETYPVINGWQASAGLAQGTSQHEFITARMERIGTLHFELRGLVGDDAMKQLDLEDDQGGQDDPELAAIAQELQATVCYAIDPEFKERLHRKLVEMMR